MVLDEIYNSIIEYTWQYDEEARAKPRILNSCVDLSGWML